mmetsp:Transcript_17142/g.36324  ORF Transcript_17142/g.36324 Transcript_17142/m.36324 type:complete len:280 (-) Transcript_17142:269-1108(-)
MTPVPANCARKVRKFPASTRRSAWEFRKVANWRIASEAPKLSKPRTSVTSAKAFKTLRSSSMQRRTRGWTIFTATLRALTDSGNAPAPLPERPAKGHRNRGKGKRESKLLLGCPSAWPCCSMSSGRTRSPAWTWAMHPEPTGFGSMRRCLDQSAFRWPLLSPIFFAIASNALLMIRWVWSRLWGSVLSWRRLRAHAHSSENKSGRVAAHWPNFTKTGPLCCTRLSVSSHQASLQSLETRQLEPTFFSRLATTQPSGMRGACSSMVSAATADASRGSKGA